MFATKIVWIKEVKPDDKSIAYDDISEGDVFYLHWPKTPDSRIEAMQNGEIILLKQYKQITHLVSPISNEIKINNDPIYGVKYPKCREVYCVKRCSIPVIDILGKECNDQGLGIRIQNFINMDDDHYAIWTSDTIALIGLSRTIDLDIISSGEEYNIQDFPEGREAFRLHKIRERNRSVINQKKKQFKSLQGRLYCEICDFSFPQKYGEIGKDFIEVHHIRPLNEQKKETITTVNDLILVCSNCHRMIHKLKPMKYTISEIMEEILINS
jgi:hypothetical protein